MRYNDPLDLFRGINAKSLQIAENWMRLAALVDAGVSNEPLTFSKVNKCGFAIARPKDRQLKLVGLRLTQVQSSEKSALKESMADESGSGIDDMSIRLIHISDTRCRGRLLRSRPRFQ